MNSHAESIGKQLTGFEGLGPATGFLFFAFFLAFFLFAAWTPSFAQSPGGLSTRVEVEGDITATASDGGTASNRIGSTDGYSGSGSATTTVRGSVVTIGRNGAQGTTTIGDPSVGGNTSVVGRVTNLGGKQRLTGNTSAVGNVTTMRGTDLKLGGCGRTNVVGDVFLGGGSLEIGCACAGRRNGKCCVVFHNALCVLHQVPPGKHGCPPGYIYSGGLCRLYSDFSHAYGK